MRAAEHRFRGGAMKGGMNRTGPGAAENLHQGLLRARLQLRKHWWVLVIAILLGMAFRGYVELNRPQVYQSTARMLIAGRVHVGENQPRYREENREFLGTQVLVMQSETVQARAREIAAEHNPELAPAVVTLGVEQPQRTSVFILRTQGNDARYTRAFLNGVIEAYQELRRDMRTSTSSTTLAAINQQLSRLEGEIDQGEEAVVEFQRANNMVFVEEQVNTAGTFLARLKNQVADLEAQLRQTEALSIDQVLEGGLSNAMAEELIRTRALDSAAAFVETKRRRDALVAERDEFSVFMRPRHPKIIQLSRDIERADNLLRIYRRQGLEELDVRKRVLADQIRSAEAEIVAWEERALEYSRLLAEFKRLNDRLERAKAQHETLRNSIQSIDFNLSVEQDTVTVLEHASPAAANRAQLGRGLAQGGVVGFSLGVAVIFLIAVIGNRVDSTDDLTVRFEAPVLGNIPFVRRQDSKSLHTFLAGDDHTLAEAYRTVRSSILFIEQDGVRPRLFAITSAIPSEGKSTISGNLAAALAVAGSRTVLVDADLRRGRMGRTFGFEGDEPGLADVLQGTRSLEEVIRPTAVDNLDLVTTGKYPRRPGELLLSKRLDAVFEELLERYEYVLLDTAPILATDDTMGFASKVDAVLFVVRAGYTQYRHVGASVDRLRLRGAAVFGFVANFADIAGTDYYYYKKYQSAYAPAGASQAE